ncbi:hypothetical protein SS52_4158 [Escherichia coli O157:H7 str. SS52]|nr:hypothetical protein SS52_4158 [Escherichia coli O157:H7 str. SS52]ERD90897.1 hypothetical protein S31_3640 [Escherichia coli B86]
MFRPMSFCRKMSDLILKLSKSSIYSTKPVCVSPAQKYQSSVLKNSIKIITYLSNIGCL